MDAPGAGFQKIVIAASAHMAAVAQIRRMNLSPCRRMQIKFAGRAMDAFYEEDDMTNLRLRDPREKHGSTATLRCAMRKTAAEQLGFI